MPRDEEGLTDAAGRRVRARLGAFLLVALAAQVVILVAQHGVFFDDLFRFPSRLGAAGEAPPGSSLLLVAGLAAVAWLWARRGGEGCVSARIGVAGLANLSGLGLVPYAVGLATGRLVVTSAAVTLAISGAAAVLLPRRSARSPASFFWPPPAWGDAVSAAALATLLVPAFFPFIHFDTVAIWGCRAAGFSEKGFFGALVPCVHPEYPPLFSILLGLGASDPLFQGRLVVWLLVVFFALFARDRFARALPSAAPLALAFLLSVVHVWQGSAMYYANVALMAFLSVGLLLVFGLPRTGEIATTPSNAERFAGTLCLAAAVLVRPDGVYYLAAAAVAILLAWRWDGLRVPLLPFAVAAMTWASWSLRPDWLKAPGLLSQSAEGWRSLAPTPLAAAGALFREFVSSWQGQWLSHKGLGATLYAVAAAAIADLLLGYRESPADSHRESEKRLYGLVTLCGLTAVVVCFAAFPFVTDPVAAVQPLEKMDYQASYRNFVRVGLGRMTIHLLPFFVLYVLAVLRPPAPEPAANIEKH